MELVARKDKKKVKQVAHTDFVSNPAVANTDVDNNGSNQTSASKEEEERLRKEKENEQKTSIKYIASEFSKTIEQNHVEMSDIREAFNRINTKLKDVASVQPLLKFINQGWIGNYFIELTPSITKEELEERFKFQLTNETYSALENLFKAIRYRQKRV